MSVATTHRNVQNSDRWRRMLRTAVQVGLVQMVLQGVNLFAPQPLSTEQYAFLTTALTTGLSLAQNYLEDTAVLPEMLKAPSTVDTVTSVPMPEPHG